MDLKRWAAVSVAAGAVAIGSTGCGNSSPQSNLNAWGDCAMNVLAAHGDSPTASDIPADLQGAVASQCGTGPG